MRDPSEVIACEYCGKVYKERRYKQEHERSCPKNAERVQRECPICREKFVPKYFNRHMRRVHNWSG